MSSPKQLQVILFEKLGLPTKGVRRGKTGYSTDSEVLEKLAMSEMNTAPSVPNLSQIRCRISSAF